MRWPWKLQRHLVRELRTIFPPHGWLIFVVIFVATADCLWHVLMSFDTRNDATQYIIAIRDWFILLNISVYGVYRVFAFHPMFDADYRHWLESSPWQKGAPLPRGAIYPDIGDGILVIAAMLALTDSCYGFRLYFDFICVTPTAHMVVTMFAIVHASAVATVAWLTDGRRHAYISAFLISVAIRVGQDWPVMMAVVLVGGWGFAFAGLAEGWKSFPWRETINQRRRARRQYIQSPYDPSHKGEPELVSRAELGWPFGVLSPQQPLPKMRRVEQLLIGALISFSFHCLVATTEHIELFRAIATALATIGIILLAVAAYGIPANKHASPLRFSGRMLLLRCIIPGYDRVFVVPAIILLSAIITGILGHYYFGSPSSVTAPLALFAAITSHIYLRLDSNTWQMTAPCRIVTGSYPPQFYDQLS